MWLIYSLRVVKKEAGREEGRAGGVRGRGWGVGWRREGRWRPIYNGVV